MIEKKRTSGGVGSQNGSLIVNLPWGPYKLTGLELLKNVSEASRKSQTSAKSEYYKNMYFTDYFLVIIVKLRVLFSSLVLTTFLLYFALLHEPRDCEKN